MNLTGKMTKLFQDFGRNKTVIELEVADEPDLLEALGKLKNHQKLNISVSAYKGKRSLDANATLWFCIGQIAAALGADKWKIYLEALKRYGKFTHIVVKEQAVDEVKRQWRECEDLGKAWVIGEQGKPVEGVQMLCYYGSSTYNTEEFSKLLNGVISEMVEMGLDPPAPKEVEKALDMHRRDYEKTAECIY